MLAVALLAIPVVGAHSQQPPEKAAQSNQARDKAEPSLKPPPPGAVTEKLEDAEGYAPNCEQPRSEQESALCAQWVEATWTKNQGLIQAIALMAALITLFFTYRSLRAYVFFGYTNLRQWDGKVAIDVLLKNQGTTPAEITEWALYDDPVRQFQDEPHYPIEGQRKCALILGNAVPWLVNEPRLLPAEDRVLYGFVRYKDIFGVTHTSRFCDALNGKALQGDKPRIDAQRHGGDKWSAWD